MENKNTVQELAKEYLEYFQTKKRAGDETFICLKEETPEELRELVRNAHEIMFPDDYKYRYIEESLEIIAETNDEDIAFGCCDVLEADIYNYSLLGWLQSNLYRISYVDEAVDAMGHVDLMVDIAQGQLLEKKETYINVLETLKDILSKKGVRKDVSMGLRNKHKRCKDLC